jgi:MalT-like TPR region
MARASLFLKRDESLAGYTGVQKTGQSQFLSRCPLVRSPWDFEGQWKQVRHITLARVLIAEYNNNRIEHTVLDALRFLERLLRAAEEGKRTGSVIEILILQTLAHSARGNKPQAFAALKRALTLAEPKGYMRIFVA